MSHQTATVGQTGEDVAVKFLEQNGYTVIARNYRSGHHEIDIIAHDHEFLVFVEVKTRSCHIPESMTYGRPSRAVGLAKQRNVVLAAQNYLRQHPQNTLQPRLDVIEVYLKKTVEGAPPQLLNIHHIRNAFLAR
ncbi:MAG: YraN family protein [Clostridia bacterium]|nr:YraN family protein [Clostridia bacterium]